LLGLAQPVNPLLEIDLCCLKLLNVEPDFVPLHIEVSKPHVNGLQVDLWDLNLSLAKPINPLIEIGVGDSEFLYDA
jgi:hypothetical protein